MKPLVYLFPALAFCAASSAHEPAPAKTATKAEVASGLMIEAAPGKNPWNHLELKNDPKAFQFAVVTDRTGGHRPGVFEDAIHKLNLLQPEFVMSVGDLIEGYTRDRKQIDREWDEFQGFIAKLQMPFFYVPGNHDFSNPEMAAAWKERFGRDYYAFVYREVLFVCLNSQEPQMHHIGEEQARWLESTLAKHSDVRWTLVFMHSPLWDESYPTDRGWQRIEKALGNRRHTVFSGHFHSYMKRSRNDNRYYTLATTGGGSGLRGLAHGEFDHVAWVTMTDAGPLVTNLLLQGIWGDDIRTPEIRDLVRKAGAGAMISVAPVVLPPGPAPEKVSMELLFTNPLETPVEVTFSLVPGEGVAARLDAGLEKEREGRYKLVLQPQAQKTAKLEIKPGDAYSGDILHAAAIVSEATFLTEAKLPVTLRATTNAMLMPLLTFGRAGKIVVDGNPAEWPDDAMMQVHKPGDILKNADSWKGPNDASFAWLALIDEHFLYVAVKVTDEEVLSVREKLPWQQDGVELRIDLRPSAVRAAIPGEQEAGRTLLIAMSPSESAEDRWIYQPKNLPEGTKSICVRTKSGYVLETAIPLAALEKANTGWREDGVRINLAIDDLDGDQSAQLWWQPDWRSHRNIPGAGTFFPPASR